MKFQGRNAAPLMVLTVFILTLASRSLNLTPAPGDAGPYLTICVIQIIAVLTPAAVFCKLRGAGYLSRLRLRRISAEQLAFLIFMLVALVAGGTLLMLLMERAGIGTGYSIYDAYGAGAFYGSGETAPGDTLYSIVTFAVLPAICEEFTFRAVYSAEYGEYGGACAALSGSVMFAMLHFNLELFPLYFFCGIILSVTLYATRSLLGSVALHFLFNLYVLFGAPLLPEFLSGTDSDLLLIFLLTVIFLLALALAMGEGGRLYKNYARRYPAGDSGGNGRDYEYTEDSKYKKYSGGMADRGVGRRENRGAIEKFAAGAFSPAALLCVLFYVIAVIGQ